MINSRDVNDLVPRVRDKAIKFREVCAARGHPILITSTYRDDESQNELYAQGRTKPGKIVTNLEGGHSYHNWKVAFDFVPLVNGKPEWGNDALWEKCGKVGEECGLQWGGRWNKFIDKPHMQDPAGNTITDFLLGKAVDRL